MSFGRKEIYEFGDYRLDVEERTIERLDGVHAATLPDKTLKTLVMLLRWRKAFEMLERGYRDSAGFMSVALAVGPQLDPIRDDPRHRDLLR